jgi:hypothetical protein
MKMGWDCKWNLDGALLVLGIGFWEGFIYRRRKQVGREGRREMIVD